MNRRRSRSHSRGVTPIGAALVVFVFGAGASCLWWAQSANAARDAQSSSRTDAGQIQAAAESFRAQHSDGCPTLTELAEERFLSEDARQDDAWGNRFHVRCDDDQIVVSSAGPDGVLNTADDIRVPR
ncbi:MAG TPA: hypothetical protein VK745_20430 [Polyangiaceae bacterium]|jgi:hypothetical protein|nr:hypothetical protein [Polyangiaceae bacterium]